MLLIVLTVVVVAVLIAVLAIFLFIIGSLLNRTANNLDDCAQNVKSIAYHADAIGPGVTRINETGTTVIGALPLLVDGAERIAVAKGAPYVDPDEAPPPRRYSAPSRVPAAVAPAPAPVPAAVAPAPSPAPAAVSTAVPATASRNVGYMDDDEGNLGYLDS